MFGLKELRLAAAKATKMSEALTAAGIDPEATDLSAAIAEKVSASSVTTSEIVTKAAHWDKFCAQCATLKIDPLAAVASDTALEAMIDSAARELLADHVGKNSAETVEHKEPVQSAPTGFAVASQWNKLCADASANPGNDALAKARDDFYAAHQDEILANVNFTTHTK